MRSASGRRIVGNTIRIGGKYVKGYSQNSAKKQFSQKTTYQARDSASLTVSSNLVLDNFYSGYLNMWNVFRSSQSFNAIQRMFEQVSISGMSVQLSLTNVVPADTSNNTNGSVSVVRAWDRDGVFQQQMYFDQQSVEKQTIAYNTIQRMSACRTDNVGISSATKVIYDKIFAEAMQEKGMYISSDLLQTQWSSTNGFENVLGQKLSQWNPTLLLSLQPGFKAQLQVSFKFFIICRGVRILSDENDSKPPYNVTLPIDVDNVQGFLMTRTDIGPRKIVSGSKSNFIDYSDLSKVQTTYSFPTSSQIGQYIEAYNSANPQMQGKFLKFGIQTATSMTKLDMNSNDAVYIIPQGYDNKIYVGRSAMFTVIEDAQFNNKITTSPIIAHVTFSKTGGEQAYYHSSSNNAWFSFEKFGKTIYGIRPYSEEISELDMASMRVDGSKCYSAEKGGIYIEGYYDLNGPNPIDDDQHSTGQNAIGIAFTRIGDVSVGSDENNAILKEYNIQNTGPQFVEVASDGDAFTQSVVPGQINFDEWNDSALVDVNADHGPTVPSLSVTIPPETQQLIDAAGVKVVLTVTVVDGTQPYDLQEVVQLGQARTGISFHLYLRAVFVDGHPTTDPQVRVAYQYQTGVVETAGNAPMPVSGVQLLNLYRLILPSTTFSFRHYITPNGTDFGYYTNVEGVQLLPSTSFFTAPVEASKIWARIKGFFTSAWKSIKNIVPQVASVVSPILPPPYGTVVSVVGSTISNIDNAITAVSTAAVKQPTSIDGVVSVEDTDVFQVTPEFRVFPYDANNIDVLDVTLPYDDQWYQSGTYEVQANSLQDNYILSSHSLINFPGLYRAIQQYKENVLQLGASDDDAKLGIQQRAKVVFYKQCTEAQAQNYMTTLRLGVTQSFNTQEQNNYTAAEVADIINSQNK